MSETPMDPMDESDVESGAGKSEESGLGGMTSSGQDADGGADGGADAGADGGSGEGPADGGADPAGTDGGADGGADSDSGQSVL